MSKKFKSIEKLIEDGSDKDCLVAFLMLVQQRVFISTEFIQNDVGFITHEVMVATSGEKQYTSPPIQLDWPLEPVVMPNVDKEKLN